MTTDRSAVAQRQQAGQVNRLLGYVMVPVLLLNSAVYYSRHHDATGLASDATWHDCSHALLVAIFAVHVALSLYVFGLVRPRRTLRVFHIYFGYATFVIVMLSQTGLTHGHLRDALTVLMYVTIGVHIVIGARYGVARSTAQVPERRFARVGENA